MFFQNPSDPKWAEMHKNNNKSRYGVKYYSEEVKLTEFCHKKCLLYWLFQSICLSEKHYYVQHFDNDKWDQRWTNQEISVKPKWNRKPVCERILTDTSCLFWVISFLSVARLFYQNDFPWSWWQSHFSLSSKSALSITFYLIIKLSVPTLGYDVVKGKQHHRKLSAMKDSLL